MQTYGANDNYVDQLIGSAYQVVKYVAANMDTLVELSEAIPVLTTYIDDIRNVLANLPTVSNVSSHMAELVRISDNLNSLIVLHSNLTSLVTIANNLSQILAVPAAIAAQDWKNSVAVATTANLSLSGLQTVDGVVLQAGDRVLVKNQSIGSANGIYVADSGTWQRASDSSGSNVSTGNMTVVDRGTLNGGKLFRLATVGTIVLGTTIQTWAEVIPNATTTTKGLVRLATDAEFVAGTPGVAVTPQQLASLDLGEDNSLASTGTGASLVATKTGEVLGIKSIKAGDNVTVTDDGAGSLVIASTGGGGGSGGSGGEVNTASSLGNGQSIVGAKVGSDLRFKSLKAGTNVAITGDATELVISSTSSGESNTLASQGDGTSLVGSKTGSTLGIKSIVAGSNVTIDEGTDEITINASGGGGGGASLNIGSESDYGSGNLSTPANLLFADADFAVDKLSVADSVVMDLNRGSTTDFGKALREVGVITPPAFTPIIEDFEDTSYNLPLVTSWALDTSQFHGGTKSLKSNTITHNQTTSVRLDNYNFTADVELTFWAYASCENNYDGIKYYLDNVELGFITGNPSPWAKYTIQIPAGVHSVRWDYVKDSSGSNGSDAGWIDDIRIAAPTNRLYQKVAVLQTDVSSIMTNGTSKATDLTYRTANNFRRKLYATPGNNGGPNAFVPHIHASVGNQFYAYRGGGQPVSFSNSPQGNIAALLSATAYSLAANQVLMLPIVIPTPFMLSSSSVGMSFVNPFTGTMEVALYESDPETGLPGKLASKGSSTVSGYTSMGVSLPIGTNNYTHGLYWLAICASAAADFKCMDSWRAYLNMDSGLAKADTHTIGAAWPNPATPISTWETDLLVPYVTFSTYVAY